MSSKVQSKLSSVLELCKYQSMAFLGGFWAFAIQDFACSLKDGAYCISYLLSIFSVAGFGLAGGACLAFGVMFCLLWTLRQGRIGQAIKITSFVALSQAFWFELGIRLTDQWEWKNHVLAMQQAPFLRWSGWFTNEFLFWLSGIGLVSLFIAWEVARVKRILKGLDEIELSRP